MKHSRCSTLRALIAPGALALVLIAVLATPVAAQVGGHYQTSDIVDFATGGPVAGAATLLRTRDSLSARIATSGLDTDAAYTVWWVLWNDPSLCTTTPCGEADLGIPGNSVFYATGFVTGMDGTGNATAYLEAGRLPEGIEMLILGGLRPGKGLQAEAHMVIRSHGSLIPGSVADQIGTFAGGCAVNVCEDQQAVVFAPVS